MFLKQKRKCREMATIKFYSRQKCQVAGDPDEEVLEMFKLLVKSRVWMDFRF